MISYGKEKKPKRKGEKGVYIEPTEKPKSQRDKALKTTKQEVTK